MKKLIITSVLLLMFIASIIAQEPVYNKGKNYRGLVFDSSFFVMKSIQNQIGRFTPSINEVENAEKILKTNISLINSKKINQGDGCPVIDRKLKKYFRQYIGFINERGEKVIWINLFWNKNLLEKAKVDIIGVNDGCSYYWDVQVNLNTKELTNLDINGKG